MTTETTHEQTPCPACVEGQIPVEPYLDHTGQSVDCSRCWDTKQVCHQCESKAQS